MKKLVKLLRDPALFFQDAARNRRAATRTGTPTYVVGFSTWKQYMRKFFPDRNLTFLPREITEHEFKLVWSKKILSDRNAEIFIWGFKAPPYILQFIKKNNVKVVFVEDGFVRSVQLGASKAPPMSLCLDSRTPYFNARETSDLEVMLNKHDFAAAAGLLERADKAIELLLKSGVSKYNHAAPVDLARLYGAKNGKRVLVIGQVEDDASIEFGCEQTISNNDLVKLAAKENPGAQIIYKPHPDVLAGHRDMQSNPEDVAGLALILRDKLPLAQALDTVDHVYTITSLAGFEALLRGIKVTTLGAPFYAGWGLTDDRQATPRRQRKLTLRELFAGAYLLYPRYFDPSSGEERQLEDIVALIASDAQLAASAESVPSAAANAPAKVKPADIIEDDPTALLPTYLVGDDLDYRGLMGNWFDERSFTHIPAKTTEAEFVAKFKKAIDRQRRAEFFVSGDNVALYLRKYIAASGKPVTYISEGPLRSVGLAGNAAPPYSLLLDRSAPHYDARRSSDLEEILNGYDFEADTALMERAALLQASLLHSGLNKYNHVAPVDDLQLLYGVKDRPRVLVLGQVEGTTAFKMSNPRGYTNNDLVTIAAMENPGAHIIFKPHPNVLNKFQSTVSNPAKVAHLCQVLEQDLPLAQALETIDKVYTISSLGGFEALLRDIPTTTLGQPFYAGWGLGDDRQVLARRQRTLTVQQVFVAAYVLYPVYVNPLYKMAVNAERAVSSMQAHVQEERIKAATSALAIGVEIDPLIPLLPSPIPTYILGDLPYKSLLRACFNERRFIYIPALTSATEFVAKFKKAIVDSKTAEFFIVGDDCSVQLRKIVRSFGRKISYLNDGFLRSIELKEKNTAPHSLLLDNLTPHYDARKPSCLENILNEYNFESDKSLLARSEVFIRNLISSGISKYNHVPFTGDAENIYGMGNARRVLVLGQIEQAASVKLSNPREYTNNDLILIAKNENPDAHIIFKPHPDVINGYAESISDAKKISHLCHVLDADLPLPQALETVDQVYTISSLGGFEALLRGIKTTVLGVPFYAGWGIADDREVVSRRKRKLTINEVFAAAYILYPYYIDPLYKKKVTGEEVLAKLKNNRIVSLPAINAKPEELLKKADPKLKNFNLIKVLADSHDNLKPRAFLFGFGQNKTVFYAEQFAEYNVYTLDNPVSKQVLLTSQQIMDIFKPKNGDIFVVWGKKDGDQGLENELISAGVTVARIEDAFIRSVDLGSVNSTPLSYVFDLSGIYFDSGSPSALENILNQYDFQADKALMERARTCMSSMLSSGASKYNHASKVDIQSIYGPKIGKRVLVLGQVEDDASIKFGCAKKITNNDLVILARLENPDAQIIYKPHPDVLSGMRKRYSDPALVESISQVLYDPVSIADAFETIDHVYAITSLSGFEALMRGIKVTTYGCPFYSGWGLTDERQKNVRRTRVLSVEEIFAAAYILYSTYVNPFTKEKIEIEEALELLSWMKNSGIQPISHQGDVADSRSQRLKTSSFVAKGELSLALVSSNIAVGAYGDFESYISRAKTKVAAGIIGNSVNSDFEYSCVISQWKSKSALIEYARYLWEFEGYDKKLHSLLNAISGLVDLSDSERILVAAMLCDGGYITKAKNFLGGLIDQVISNPSGYLKLYSILVQEQSDSKGVDQNFELLDNVDAGTTAFENLILNNLSDFCVVGNSPVEIGKKHGEAIDSFSQVIRFNAYDVGYPYSVDYGSKATVWVRMPKNMGVPDGKRKNIDLVLISGPNWTARLVDGVETFSRLQKQFNVVGVVPFSIYVKLIRETGAAPSAGLQILYWIYSLIGPIPRRQVYGFELTDQMPGRNLHYRGGKNSVVRHDWIKEKAVFERIINN